MFGANAVEGAVKNGVDILRGEDAFVLKEGDERLDQRERRMAGPVCFRHS